MLLEASTTKIEDTYYVYIYIFVYLYVHIHMYSHYICIMLIYTMFSPYPKTPPLEVAASQGKVRIVKAIISWGSPKWSSDWSVWKDNRSSQWSFLHLYIVYVQCVFFVARSEYVCIYHEWTLWMKPRWLFMFAARFLHRWWVATKTQTLSCTHIQNCKHFFTDSGTYHCFLVVVHGYFFMTFINITFGVIKFHHKYLGPKPLQIGYGRYGSRF